MPADRSDRFQYFGYQDFKVFEGDPAKLQPPVCPIKNCSTIPGEIPYRNKKKPFCPTHGIRLHSKTFVYWNGEEHKDKARLRNFRILPKLAREIALGSVEKAESYRLGYEMSEDALTWNVFVGLAEAGKLRQAVKILTGRDVDREPDLYLWGKLVDVTGSRSDSQLFEPLREVRWLLEQDIRKFKTEPDVMLVLDGQLVICVEAKFGSGNTLAYEGEVKDGDKPVDRAGLLQRYLDRDRAPAETRRIIDPNPIIASAVFHSQLFRNIVFASAMANGCDWHVVNLVSTTQWELHKDSKDPSFANPEESIRSYLHPSCHKCFSFRNWEELHKKLVKDESKLIPLDTYFRTKSAHYHRAFNLD